MGALTTGITLGGMRAVLASLTVTACVAGALAVAPLGTYKIDKSKVGPACERVVVAARFRVWGRDGV